ncbi:helix-turn-helix domain-containing protein [Sphaerisporangium viridialbum]|uniref:helix-turn-helix domain-containing protein n=1 Tax=Sphaerisporangium viridialbum TaxID=46189 RepID=UPI003C736718
MVVLRGDEDEPVERADRRGPSRGVRVAVVAEQRGRGLVQHRWRPEVPRNETAGTRPRGGLADKRRAILAGALTVFARDGYTRATTEAISAQAGVSSRTLYNHFQDKARLFKPSSRRAPPGSPRPRSPSSTAICARSPTSNPTSSSSAGPSPRR